MHTVVERELELKLVLSPEWTIPVPSRLTYRTEDPYAVHITFHIGSGFPVHWTFARDLLVEGVFRPCGQGDVGIWPARIERRNVLCVALSSPEGDALLEVPSEAVVAWVEQTLRLVPPGTETERLGIDAALADLLAPLPADDLWLSDPWPSDESTDGEV
ncbi:SsgA family sporulation/cell division regulator [Streptomyces sp. NBC_00873]|uniref:SsgA family sporulation/cell division regulator n=1 Tax=unclassified Streptomyces TaxID=2593676 RepID=UPI00386A3DD9|nr:SsgA family sporulation/cell division regulator [Streptomyces sp. NBC_00873]WTA44048.1 SsgA family sporulation/cell division regulator [Streptomyces sp. NBC_00842]